MRRILICCLALLVAGVHIPQAVAQQYPGGQGPVGPGSVPPIVGGGGRNSPQDEIPSTPIEIKPEKAAAKAMAQATKSMAKARELEAVLAAATDPDKRARTREKLEDQYGTALEQYTEVLRNKNDSYEAWSQVGFIHLRFGAFRESIDDYNHALALKPDLLEAIERRGEAYVAVDRMDEAKAAYMDLFFHARPQADRLMAAMQAWLQGHRAAANGVRVADIDAFDKWLQERDGIAKTTASLPN
ncbi:MAG: tetratricopeptide repeat protein [Steroidobacteraceae bacterium]